MASAENIADLVKMHVANVRETEAVREAEKDIVRMLLAAKINEIDALKKEDREAEKAALRKMITAKTVEIEALKKEIDEETNIPCIHCKKTNHLAEQCFFRPGAKPAKSTILTPPNAEFAPCKFCKKTNHASEKCHFNPANAPKASAPIQVPCKFCKKTNHLAEHCHFNPTRKVQA